MERVLGDIDNDGDLDAVTGEYVKDATTHLWVNNGQGEFTKSEQRLVGAYHGALGDLDGDGDLDLFMSRQFAPNLVLWNDGGGEFTDSRQQIGSQSSTFTALGDLDGDGDLDAYVCNNHGSADSLYFNDGSGLFSEQEIEQPLLGAETAMAELFDWNGDGHLDAAVAFWGHFAHLLINDGTGRLQHNQSSRLHAYHTCVRSGDLDGDGNRGLMTLGTMYSAVPFTVIRNRSDHDFATTTNSYGVMHATWGDLGDLDGDGDLDAFIANDNNNPDQVWLNRNSDRSGIPMLVESEQVIPTSGVFNTPLADFDNDGDVDIFALGEADPGTVWLNDGSGQFIDSQQSLEQMGSGCAASGDFDGDSDMDVFVGSRTGSDRVWLNDGSGTFQATEQELEGGWSRECIPIDVDSDGDLDVFVIHQEGNDVVWVNNGAAQFESSIQLEAVGSYAGAAGDINNDGHVDLLVSPQSSTAPIDIWHGDGQGGFTRSSVTLKLNVQQALALFDINGDGNLDLFTGGSASQQSNQLFTGDGHGNFTPSEQNFAGLNMANTVSADIDLDGDLDIVTGNQHYLPNQILLNDGKGVFKHRQWLGNSHSTSQLADIDGDGDLDIIEAAYEGQVVNTPLGGRCRIWLNQTVEYPESQ